MVGAQVIFDRNVVEIRKKNPREIRKLSISKN
jgi:hypothetical protein